MMNKPEMRSCMTCNWSPVLTTSLPNSGSESDLVQRDLINERKRKRLESNRESARRSRMRKREHLVGLTTQLEQLRKDNRKATIAIDVTTEQYDKMEAENSVMRAQVTELNHRLNSLNQIIAFPESYSSAAGGFGTVTGHSAAGGFGMEMAPSAAGGFGMETAPSAAGGFGMEAAPSAAGGFGVATAPSAAGVFGMATAPSAAGGFEMETGYIAAGGFEMETGYTAAGGFGMETGQGGGVADYGDGWSSGGGGGFYDGGEMDPFDLGFYDEPPNMASASAGVGDVLNCW
ncbi:unnamed protein product [Brassica oleracea]